MPFFTSLFKYPHVLLKAYGEAVGLDKNYIGGSEVGHLHLCSGRIVPQDLKVINDSIVTSVSQEHGVINVFS